VKNPRVKKSFIVYLHGLVLLTLVFFLRFNSYDGRLERSMEAVVLLTEALKGYEARIRYDMYAHSGEEHALELVRIDRPPENEKERLQVS
jgi:hypothetical protein